MIWCSNEVHYLKMTYIVCTLTLICVIKEKNEAISLHLGSHVPQEH